MGDMKKIKVKSILSRILFSHVGLSVIVCAYAVAGAYLFQYIELGKEERDLSRTQAIAKTIEDAKRFTIEDIIEYCENYAHEWYPDGQDHITFILDRYHNIIKDARTNTTEDGNRHPYKGTISPEQYAWSAPSAILFAASILSTVGKFLCCLAGKTGVGTFSLHKTPSTEHPNRAREQ